MRTGTSPIYIGMLMLSTTFPISCGPQDDTGSESEEEEEVSTEFVSLTQRQMEVIGLRLTRFEQRNIEVRIPVTGRLELAPQDRADVSPMIGGIVKEIRVFEGDAVQKGSILAVLEHPDLMQLQQDHLADLSTLEYLEKEHDRQKTLSDEKVGSEKMFEKAEAEYLTKKSRVAATRAKFALLGIDAEKVEAGIIFPSINMFSPIDGKVSLVEVNVGSYIAPDQKVFEIVNNKNIHADVTVYQKDIAKVKVGQTVHFNIQGRDEVLEARIHAISPNVESEKSGIHVHCSIAENSATLIPEMYIRGEITVENINALTLPKTAVIENEGLSYIFVRTEAQQEEEGEESDEENEDKWTFRKTEVVVGHSGSEYIQIKRMEPISDDAEVVGYGAYYLLAEMGKGEVEDDD